MLALGGLLAAAACGRAAVAPAVEPAADAAFPDPLATIGDKAVTMADVRARIGADLDMMEARYRMDRHAAVEATLEQIVRERVLQAEADQRKQSLDELIAAEAGGSLDPSDNDVAAWYMTNQGRLGGRSLDMLRPQIVEFLRNQRREEASRRLEERLTREQAVTVHLEPYRLSLDNTGAPALGPENAPITLVEFSDFQCPYCARFAPTLHQLKASHGDKVRIVYRQYPLTSIHPEAVKAAEASLCAHEQGKFWEMHDVLFEAPDQLQVAQLKQKAGRLGLDQRRFDTCLDSGQYGPVVEKDLKEGQRAGVNGTPALFVNGVPIPGGAVPYETVVQAIEKELGRISRRQ
jgi:protein-disulfide isomerase